MNEDYKLFTKGEKFKSITDEMSHKEFSLPTHWIISFTLLFVLPRMLGMGSILTNPQQKQFLVESGSGTEASADIELRVLD